MGCCCGNAAWKREEVPDHKFDFIDVRDYHTDGLWTKTCYGFLFALVVKSFAVYIADIYTAVTLLALNHFNGSVYNKVQNSQDNTVPVPITYSKWIFFGCIVFSFLLLAYEAHKCRAIVRSRDISYAYTNVMANNYYSLRSYDHFCLFSQINNSTKKQDEIAFFIFFTFKGWKRLIVADGPRQVINALTLYGLLEVNKFSTNVYDYYNGSIFTAIMLLTMIFTVVIFAGSAILLLVASVMYLPLLCYIKGNLKEYCCHKIDKRITELVHVKKKQRVKKQAAIARAEAKGDFKHLMNKKGVIVGQKMVQPTLPKVEVDLYHSGQDEKGRLAANNTPSPSMAAVRYAGNAHNSPYSAGMGYGDDYGSQAHLVLNQGFAGDGSSNVGHSVHGSTSEVQLAPSIPPSTHNSPDVYPMHVRGNGLSAAPSASSARLVAPSVSQQSQFMSQLGPIGTSPQLFAHRVVNNNNNDPSAAFNSDATASTVRNVGHDADNAMGYSQKQAAAYGDAHASQQGYDQQYYQQNGDAGDYYGHAQTQGTESDYAYADYTHAGGHDYDHDQHTQSYQTGSHDAKAYSGDLSAYAPYHENQQSYEADYYGQNAGYAHNDATHASGYQAEQHSDQQYDYYGTDGFGGGAGGAGSGDYPSRGQQQHQQQHQDYYQPQDGQSHTDYWAPQTGHSDHQAQSQATRHDYYRQ
ncbi:unnamed protein product [Parajaminaea phylloscopi]